MYRVTFRPAAPNTLISTHDHAALAAFLKRAFGAPLPMVLDASALPTLRGAAAHFDGATNPYDTLIRAIEANGPIHVEQTMFPDVATPLPKNLPGRAP